MSVIYTGIFFDEITYKLLKSKSNTETLDHCIHYPHVTLEFKPKNLLPNEILGKEVEVTIIGEGNNGKNQGYEVILSQEIKESYYRGAKQVHITMSVNRDSTPLLTAKLNFKPMLNSFTVKGKLGYFTTTGVKYEN